MSEKVATYYGKKLDEYTKEELMNIVVELGALLEQDRSEHLRQLDVLRGLLSKKGAR